MNRSRTSLVALLLAATLALTSLLAFGALDAARSHRFAAESALREYAGFAAAEFVRRAQYGLSDALLFGLLRPAIALGRSSPAQPWPPPRVLANAPAPARGLDLRQSGRIAYFFLLHFDDSRFEATRAVAAGEAAWIGRHATDVATAFQRNGMYFGLAVDSGPAGELGAAYLVKPDASGRATAAYGAAFSVQALTPIFAAAATSPLLPRIAGRLSNDSVLSIRVVDVAGRPVYASAARFDDSFVGEDTLPAQSGGLRVRVAVRPEATAVLLIGGLPPSRLPLILAVLLLTALLLGATVLVLRREAALARLRTDFVANVSHELRTPLAQIRLFAETLLLGRVRSDEERHRSLVIVHQESRRLAHLVENLLHFSRAERGTERLGPEDIPLEPFVRDVIAGFAPLAAERGVTLRAEVEPALAVRADPDALRQMLLNLLDNTLKYGPPGQTVTVRAAADHAMVQLSVDDEGPGVPHADRQRVFERFTRLDSGTRAATGTGIGLAVVHELAARLHGRAWVEDAPVRGARFVLALPAAGETQRP